jgi:exopolysaccharide production protein ExoQ
LAVRLIAFLLWALATWQLFRLDPLPKDGRVSKASWVPFIWIFLAMSRNVSAWLQINSGGASDAYLEGSPFDRAVLTVILAVGVIILCNRGQKALKILQSNIPILLYFLYCGVSILWSDFPDVAFKRWFRAMGDVVMILIILTDPDWFASVRRLLTRLGYWLAPLSILLIRYFPEMGRSYSRGGRPFWTGAATDKNALGMFCMILGLAAIYRFLEIYRGKEGEKRRGPLMAQGAMILMTFYLLREADSATAFSCFFMGGGIMLATYFFKFARKTVLIHAMVLAVLAVSASALFLGLGGGMVQDLGRDSTLTGRTEIWHYALAMVKNPLIGAGYESFWVGPRLFQMARSIDQGVNQAHNGYIELYLNLGWIGLTLLALLLLAGYRRIASAVRKNIQAGNLRLAYFVATLAYNFTEAGFKMMHPVWIFFLMSAAIPPAFATPEAVVNVPSVGPQALPVSPPRLRTEAAYQAERPRVLPGGSRLVSR